MGNLGAIVCFGVVAAGCGSKSNEAAPTAPDLVGKVVPLRWTTPGGEPLLALTAGGEVEGPCGSVGKLAGGDIVIGTQKLTWSGVERTGRTYKVAPLPWMITVGSAGEVTLIQDAQPAVPLGNVTGTETEAGAKLFAALVVAAPTVQITLSFTSADGKIRYDLTGPADLDAWSIKQGTTTVKTRTRDQPAISATHPIRETPDGTVTQTAGNVVLGTLSGRKACKPHDKAVTALIETYLAR